MRPREGGAALGGRKEPRGQLCGIRLGADAADGGVSHLRGVRRGRKGSCAGRVPCAGSGRRERHRLLARTFVGCCAGRERSYPKEHQRCRDFGGSSWTLRAQVEVWLAEVTVCARDGCTKRLESKRRLAWVAERN
ncbi:hypothetical protein GCM10022207_91050 [Streptomyces lannensis]|uniref:Uncharacterized protein n=1 Tax=Streptomyces lannensis TaxID=766498 RepID=A0ABP7LTZ0_9ACTN